MIKDNALKKELSLTKAGDLLWVYTGGDVHRMLVIDKNWSSDEYEINKPKPIVET